MIIYGWGYFNRRDHSIVRETCPGCGKHGHFKSYTASKFFTLYFVPVIPLGTEKIISECPSCKRALTMSSGKWTKLKNAQLPTLLSKYESAPSDASAAHALLDALMGFHARSTLQRVSPQIRAAFARDGEMLAHLARAHSHLCMDRDADAVYLEAIGQSADERIAADANTHLESQKLPRPTPPNRLLQSLPVMIVPAALVLLFGHFAQKAVSSRPDEAYIINGLDHAYDVVINGKTVSLKPHQRASIDSLVFGENQIAPAGSHGFIPPARFQIDVPWYRRAFDNTLVVVNPDQAVVMLWERTGYAYPKPPDGSTGQYRLTSGTSAHIFEDIDFPFTPFPETIETPKNGSIVYRTRVSEFTLRDPQEVARALIEEKQTDALHGYLSAKLRSPDADMTLIHLGANFLPRAGFLPLAEAHLEARPVQIEWHRAYQTLVENTPEGSNLLERYRSYVAREPEESSLLYLCGRIVPDLDESVAMFERASAAAKPSPYAANALAFHYLLDGDFARALTHSEQALALAPTHAYFKNTHEDALHGRRDYPALLKLKGDPLASKNPTYSDAYTHVYLLGKLDRAQDADRFIGRFFDRLAKDRPMDAKARAQGIAYLKTAAACAQRDKAAFLAALSSLEGSGWQFQKALVSGDLAAASRITQKDTDATDLAGRLSLYILLAQSGKTAAAATELEGIIHELSQGVHDQKLWAGWLGDTPPPDVRVAAHSCYDADLHYVYLAALAQRHPARSADYLAQAAAMKTHDSFHSLAIGHLLSASASPKR